MSEALLTAIVTAAVTLIGIIIQSRAQHIKTMAEMDKRSEMSDQRLDAKLDKMQAVNAEKFDTIEKKMDKHNNMIERVYVLEEKAKSADRRLTDLEHQRGA